jgi:hypothetical protein
MVTLALTAAESSSETKSPHEWETEENKLLKSKVSEKTITHTDSSVKY